MRYIIKEFSPKIYASEWFAGRFDCGCRYHFGIFGYEVDCKKPGKLGKVDFGLHAKIYEKNFYQELDENI